MTREEESLPKIENKKRHGIGRSDHQRRLLTNLGVHQQRPGDSDPLLLAPRKPHPPLPAHSFIPLGEVFDELVGVCADCRLLDLCPGDIAPAISDVVGDGVVEKDGLLADYRHLQDKRYMSEVLSKRLTII